MLTERNIEGSLDHCFQLVAEGKIDEAMQIYAADVKHFNSDRFSQGRKKMAELVGYGVAEQLSTGMAESEKSITLTTVMTNIRPDGQFALVWTDFRIGDHDGSAAYLFTWSEGRPQIAIDMMAE